MKKIVTIAGSSSKKSINMALATYAANKLKNVEIITVDLNKYEMPLYNIDIETEYGIPQPAIKLDAIFEYSDGIIISLAEHNGSYTAAFKNVLDWVSRINQKVWKNKPMLLMSTSPGSRGGITVLQSAKSYFPFMGGNIISDFSLPSFYDNFSESKITNQKLEDELINKVNLFKEAV